MKAVFAEPERDVGGQRGLAVGARVAIEHDRFPLAKRGCKSAMPTFYKNGTAFVQKNFGMLFSP